MQLSGVHSTIELIAHRAGLPTREACYTKSERNPIPLFPFSPSHVATQAGWQHGKANEKWDPINLFRPGIISSCEAVSNQNAQQALALPKKEVIQLHLLVWLPCYDFTPVTSPTFGIPLLAVKVTTLGMASSHSVTGGVYKAQERIHRRLCSLWDLTHHLTVRADDNHAPPVSAFLKALLSFRRIHGMSSPGFDGGLEKPPTDALRLIISDNTCILCLTVAAGTELVDAYSLDTESGSCLSPTVADHPIRPATDRRLGKPLPHQLANQMRAPPWADSFFYSSAYGVLAVVSSCCSPPKGRIKLSMRFLVALLIAPFFVDKDDSELSFIPRHNLYPFDSYEPRVHF
eukprot:Gb_40558 [translate_table: standard]